MLYFCIRFAISGPKNVSPLSVYNWSGAPNHAMQPLNKAFETANEKMFLSEQLTQTY